MRSVVMALMPEMVAEIERIGRLRSPCEACGVLLPIPWRGSSVWEIPNRSETPHDSFELKITDLQIQLEKWLEEVDDDSLLDQVVIWHTHPRGNLGPSREDQQHKPEQLKSLVVTLYEDRPAKATWF